MPSYPNIVLALHKCFQHYEAAQNQRNHGHPSTQEGVHLLLRCHGC